MNRVIYSYYDFNKDGGGFNNVEEFLYFLSLSVLETHKIYTDIEIYTDNFGYEIINPLGLPCKVNRKLEYIRYLDLRQEFFSYPKIYAMSFETQPFIHIDYDVILWEKVREDKLFVFQCIEDINRYGDLIKLYKKALVQPFAIDESILSYGFNYGIMYIGDLSLIRIWKKYTDDYIFNTDNQRFFDVIEDLHFQCFFFEQYLFSYLIVEKFGKDSIGFMYDVETFGDMFCIEIKSFTHLWSDLKRKKIVVDKFKKKLLKNHPVMFDKIKERFIFI